MKFNKRKIIPILVLEISANLCKPAFSQERPNIIYIMSDDHAAQTISSYGCDYAQTPNIDRLGREGVQFNNCFVTNSISAPSRAVMLTGKFSHMNGHKDNHQTFDGSQTTFPKLLRKANYQTAMIGKWHLRSLPTGFDYWIIHNDQGEYYNPSMITQNDTSIVHGYSTSLITDMSIKWIDSRDKNKEFCLIMNYKAPHREWLPDTSKLVKYKNKQYKIPATLFDDYSERGKAAKEQDMTIAKTMTINGDLKVDSATSVALNLELNGLGVYKKNFKRMDDKQRIVFKEYYDSRYEMLKSVVKDSIEFVKWKYNEYMKDYLACAESVDDGIGKLLQYLDSTGLAKNTIVVYTSDNGFYMGEHGWFDKRFMYEESLRVPLLIRNPFAKIKGVVNKDLVMNLDFAPTFLDYAGVQIPDSMQGKSIKPIFDGVTKKFRDAVYYHYYEFPGVHSVKRHYGVRSDRYKLIHFYNNINEWELYDLKSDPDEMKNVYNDPKYTKVKNEMHKILENQKALYKDNSF